MNDLLKKSIVMLICWVTAVTFADTNTVKKVKRVKVDMASKGMLTANTSALIPEVKPASRIAEITIPVEMAIFVSPPVPQNVYKAAKAVLETGTSRQIEAVKESNLSDKWYDKYYAPEGSRVYWILRIAKTRAEQGRDDDVAKLYGIYLDSLDRWLTEEK